MSKLVKVRLIARVENSSIFVCLSGEFKVANDNTFGQGGARECILIVV